MSDLTKSGAISWMARNPVAANLIMLFLIIGGVMTARIIKQEVFPVFDVDTIVVSVPYPGASPEEVERGIIVAIEEAVRDIEGVKRVSSSSAENSGSIVIELLTSANDYKVLQDVKSAIDRITTLPEDAERPIVNLIEVKSPVITIVLYGDIDDLYLRDLAENVRDELLQKPEISTVELKGVKPFEISIEIPQDTLRRYGLTLNDVARIVRAASLDYSGGGVKAKGGEILLRVKERRDFGEEYGNIPIVSRPDGTIVTLGEMATIIDAFADTDVSSYFNEMPAIMVNVSREGNQTPMEVAGAVKEYLEVLKTQLPEGIGVSTFDDRSVHYQERVNLLLRNAAIGLTLVLITLGMFLNPRLAFWVTLGIPVSFMGALMFLPSFDVSINMVSLFAFIMALGIVVDDAIVVGENIYTYRQQKANGVEAAEKGTKEVAMPVVFAVLTNIVAFLPMLFLEGAMGKIFRVIPIVVCLIFFMSLIESLFILPAHLAHSKIEKKKNKKPGRLTRFQEKVSDLLENFIKNRYQPALKVFLHYRYLTLAFGVAILMIVVVYVASGRVAISFSPKAEADVVIVGLELPYGTPAEETKRVVSLLIDAGKKALEPYGGKEVYEGIYAQIGESNSTLASFGMISGGHAANIKFYLIKSEFRDFTGEQFSNEWREQMGEIPGVEKIFFQVMEMGPPAGSPVDIQISHDDTEVLEAAAEDIAQALTNFSNTKDIDDGFAPGKPQFDFKLKPEAYSLGLTPYEVGAQVRASFYGAEALRIQRGRSEVKVMVRLPEEDRRKELSIEDFLVRSPMGGEIPLSEAAELKRGRAYTKIERMYGKKTINVTANVDPLDTKDLVMNEVKKDIMPQIARKYPGLTYSTEGMDRDIKEMQEKLMTNFFIAMIAIYLMLGVVFKSYIQPLIIMAAIPFGIIGAVLGHLMMGFDISMISMMGMVALSGVVLNDSLVFIDFVNKMRKEGKSSIESVITAGGRRFRPILLTTLTTFFGLAPMIFETSFQARILVPMAISLGYGIVFATIITLVLVPCLYMVVEDIKKLAAFVWNFIMNDEKLNGQKKEVS